MARKQIPKSVRFEVFKRDKFTCQYCGKQAPEAILEVDHIKPVSKGGDNRIINLITSCRECNRGKTNRELADNSAVIVQKKQLDDIQERREQLEMVLRWREELDKEEELEVDSICSIFLRETGYELSDVGRGKIRKLIKRFGFLEVYKSTEIALLKYYTGDRFSLQYAIDKIGGVCYNRMKAMNEDAK